MFTTARPRCGARAYCRRDGSILSEEIAPRPARDVEIKAFREEVARLTEIDRVSTERPKKGLPLDAYALNPVNGERIPILVADYVLMDYGTGAIMAVPAHDQRDFEFARTYGLEIRPVIQPHARRHRYRRSITAAYSGDGVMTHSGAVRRDLDGGVGEKVTRWLEERGGAAPPRLQDPRLADQPAALLGDAR